MVRVMDRIPFNKPYVAGKELFHIAQAVTLGNIAGDGYFTDACARFLEEKFGIPHVLMTPSCTSALEIAAQLCDFDAGDEVIMPSYTFVSTANAFMRLGAKPVFVDIRDDTLNIDERLIEQAVTPRTKAIVPVHYAGVACEMDAICSIAERHNLMVVEDAAQAVNACYKGQPLGSIGQLGCYSFHETKNFVCGEGGALCINDRGLTDRAEILRDKGTNRRQFFRGEIDKYTWVEVGSSHVPSEINCAFLFGQLEVMESISARRRAIYDIYQDGLKSLDHEYGLRLPYAPQHQETNHHMFYVRLADLAQREHVRLELDQRGVNAVFHYVPLHLSPVGRTLGYARGDFPVTESISDQLLRLPMFYEITAAAQQRVIDAVRASVHGVKLHAFDERRAA